MDRTNNHLATSLVNRQPAMVGLRGTPSAIKAALNRRFVFDWALVSIFCVALFAGGMAGMSLPRAEGQERATKGKAYDVKPRRLGQIEPGTVVDKSPPRGWSDLVIKIRSFIDEQDIDKVHPIAAKMASMLSTVILANVKEEQLDNGRVRYRLSSLGIGLAADVNGQDTVVTSESQEAVGADLNIVARQVLSKAEDRLSGATLVMRSNTIAVVDMNALIVVQGSHEEVVLRHVMLVNPSSGELDTVIWAITMNERKEYDQVLGKVELLAKDLIEDYRLHVDTDRFTLGIPSETAFAMFEPPQGVKDFEITEDFKGLAEIQQFDADSAHQFEGALRQLLDDQAANRGGRSAAKNRKSARD